MKDVEFQLVCNKQDMILKYNKENNVYMLDFETKKIKNFHLNNLLDSKIYELMKKTNSDLIEEIEILNKDKNNLDNNDLHVLFIFKRFGQSAGIPQKYLLLKTVKQKTNNLILLLSQDLNYELPKMQNHTAQRMNCSFAQLTIIPFSDKIRMNYKFCMDIKEDLPIYMEHIIGLMMKKIFYNLKLYLEKDIKEDSQRSFEKNL